MSIFYAVLLGLVQGLTEFIPVSSSGHLLLLHHALGITETGLGFDVALHIGTLLALIVFFYKDIKSLAVGLVKKSPQSRLAWMVVLATIPAVIAGVLLQTVAETTFRTPQLVCVAMASMAVIMLAAEAYAKRQRHHVSLGNIKSGQALTIGTAQAVALIPGVSRSGSTIVAGMFSGLDRVAATRFSFLLSIPITFGAILKFATDADTLQQVRQETSFFIIGIVTAFVSGLIAIRFLLKFVAKHSLNVFAFYRLGLAAVVLLLLAVA